MKQEKRHLSHARCTLIHTHTHDKRYTNFYPSIYAQKHTYTLFLLLSSAWVASFLPCLFLPSYKCECAFNRTVTLLLLFLFSLQTFKRNFTDRRWWVVCVMCMHARLLCVSYISERVREGKREKETRKSSEPKNGFLSFEFCFCLA